MVGPGRRAATSARRASCRAPTTWRCRTCGTIVGRVLEPETVGDRRRPPCCARCCRPAGSPCGSRSRAGWSASVGRAAARRAHAAVAARRVGAAALGRAQPDRAADRARAAGRRLGRADRRSARSSGSAGCRSRSSRRYLAFFPVTIGALRGLQSPDGRPRRAVPGATAPAGGRTMLLAAPARQRAVPAAGAAPRRRDRGGRRDRRRGVDRAPGGIGRLIIELRPVRQRRPRQAVGARSSGRAARPGRRRPRVPARARPGSLPLRGGAA